MKWANVRHNRGVAKDLWRVRMVVKSVASLRMRKIEVINWSERRFQYRRCRRDHMYGRTLKWLELLRFADFAPLSHNGHLYSDAATGTALLSLDVSSYPATSLVSG